MEKGKMNETRNPAEVFVYIRTAVPTSRDVFLVQQDCTENGNSEGDENNVRLAFD